MKSPLLINVERFFDAAFGDAGLEPVLPPPASEREIVAVELELGLVLPAQLRELYLFCGGGLSAAYMPIGRLAEVSIFIESIFREATGDYHGPDPKYVEAGSLNTGPRSTRTLCVGGVSADVVVEVDGEDGSAGKVWRYHVHSPSSPWSLMSGSLEGHWGI